MKSCITCLEAKPATSFYRRAAKKDGLAPVCKVCHSIYKKEWSDKNRERHLATQRVRSKAYVERNREARKASMRAYREKSAGKLRIYNESYNYRNPLVRIQIKHRYWARRKSLRVERIKTELLVAKLAEYGGLCAYCQDGRHEHWDHVVPLSKGGPHTLSNLVPACAHCNHTKCANLWPAPTPPVMVASPS